MLHIHCIEHVEHIWLIVLCVSGIQFNMWKLSQEQCFITHRLLSSVKDYEQYGYEALDRESILHGNAGWLGDYTELSILPDKIARFLYEYHAESYTWLM